MSEGKNITKSVVLISIIAVLIVFTFIPQSQAGFWDFFRIFRFQKTLLEPVADQDSAPPYQPVLSLEQAVIEVVKQVSPAVVSIIQTKDVPIIEQYYINPFNDFEEFFGPFGFQFDFLQVPQYRQKGTEKREVGGGSGFIISAEGMILTNKHVVIDTESEYTVLTNDGKKYPAKVLARDPVQDLAILKIDAVGLPTVKLGDSDSIQVGQFAVTIGNALGEFRNTVSFGVVSGLRRNVSASNGGGFQEVIDEVIQTDAAINPGNSGGPLLNLKGEVIGINTAMAQGAENIGFAIPINRAKRDIEAVKSSGKIVYPFLGVRYVIINNEIKERQNLTVDYGALISSGPQGEAAVVPDSPAKKAGLRSGDIILEVNGQRIDVNNTLGRIIQQFSPGDKISLKILRGDEEKIIEVVLGERSS